MTRVMDGGQPYVGRQMRTPFQARPDVPPEERYFDILLRRIEPASDGQARLFVQALDVTEAVLTSQENQKAKAQLHAVMEEMPVGEVLLSLETRQVVLYNRAASLIVGHDVLTRSAEQFGVYGAMHADGAPFASEDYPAARALSGETIEKEEQLYRRPDGRIVRLSGDCKRVADGTGRPLAVCTFTDFTDLRQALDAKSLLVNEPNHRVKNTLATVQALAGQTFCGDAAQPGAREAFEGRLLALSRAHNVLTQADWRTASLMRIIHEAIEPFGAARFAVGGEDVQLPTQKAVAVAMALHELATNAVKYGALTREQGRVSIDCEDADGRTRLEWREQGGPPVEEPRQIGFGMRLLTRALDRDVDGGIDVTFAPTGVTCVIRGL